MDTPGRISQQSLIDLKELVRIEDVINQYVTLRNAGGGNLKGLCPFHDEKSPSFSVNPTNGVYHCFGCGAGGDAIRFLELIDGSTFREAVEQLADQVGFALTHDEAQKGAHRPSGDPPAHLNRDERTRLLDLNDAAATWFAGQLTSHPTATIAQHWLAERAITDTLATEYRIGYAPREATAMTTHLIGCGYTAKELDKVGLTVEGRHGPIDRFRGRLIFPIVDAAGKTIGFGARALFADDTGPKYLNTPETVLYKKSRVLYGLDRARKHISQSRQAVIVEGYTDVIACQASGFPNAVATCGTAFGEAHVTILRRIIGDDIRGGEVVYTFDGDKAGRNAALKAFELDSHFQTRTSVAADTDGRDPCEVRLAEGDEGIQRLMASRIPLFEFVIRQALPPANALTGEAAVNALHHIAPILASISDPNLRQAYINRTSGWLNLSQSAVAEAVGNSPRPSSPRPVDQLTPQDAQSQTGTMSSPEIPDPTAGGVMRAARLALRALVQDPNALSASTGLTGRDFPHPAYAELFNLLTHSVDSTHSTSPQAWISTLTTSPAASPTLVTLLHQLATEHPMHGTATDLHDLFNKIAVNSIAHQLAQHQQRLANPDLDHQTFERLVAEVNDLRARLTALKTPTHV